MPITSFAVAVDRDNSGKGGEKKADFIDCVAWRALGEYIAKYFTKGRMIVVDGRLEMRDWTDKEGNKRRNAEVIAGNVYFADSKRVQNNSGDAPTDDGDVAPDDSLGTEADYAVLEGDDEQLPF